MFDQIREAMIARYGPCRFSADHQIEIHGPDIAKCIACNTFLWRSDFDQYFMDKMSMRKYSDELMRPGAIHFTGSQAPECRCPTLLAGHHAGCPMKRDQDNTGYYVVIS